ncbi:hypothetical protein [Zavarzinella formosa]|uniref:hypothetical protein n=1 Tax=Zavarzinella formosa TaxID=360055 RepID=UPI00035D8CD4|nr:hypothetical protein [Zavarzinella formosa]
MAMSEQKWLTTSNARAMIRHLNGMKSLAHKPLSRKWRLYQIACAYAFWDDLPLPSQIAIEIAEAYADGNANNDLLEKANYVSEGINLSFHREEINNETSQHTYRLKSSSVADYIRRCETWNLRRTLESPPYQMVLEECEMYEKVWLAFVATWCTNSLSNDKAHHHFSFASDLMRDIFGNPFCSIHFDSRWRTSDVFGLAEGIYDDRAFARMPILADALMDAGCDDERILSHCRQDTPHVRGCWLVDMILGKS